MKKYTYTQHTPGHIAIPVKDKDGNVIMVPPDAELVKRAVAQNARRELVLKEAKAAKAAMRPGDKPKQFVIPGAMKVPTPQPQTTDAMLNYGGVYELDEQLQPVKDMVEVGYLVEVKPEPAKPVGKSAAPPIVKKDEKATTPEKK